MQNGVYFFNTFYTFFFSIKFFILIFSMLNKWPDL
jgi:hypothetical protein